MTDQVEQKNKRQNKARTKRGQKTKEQYLSVRGLIDIVRNTYSLCIFEELSFCTRRKQILQS